MIGAPTEESFEADEKEIPRILEQLRREYGEKYDFEQRGNIIVMRARTPDGIGWFESKRVEGIIKRDDSQRLWSDCFYVPQEFDGGIAGAIKERFGDKCTVSRSETPPTKFGRKTWCFRPGTKLFVTGDFKSYGEVVEMCEVVESAIMREVGANLRVVVLHEPGKRGAAEYAVSRMMQELRVPTEVREREAT